MLYHLRFQFRQFHIYLGDHADIFVSRQFADLLEMKLISNRIDYDTMIDDVEKLVQSQFENAAAPYSGLRNFEYDKYHTYNDYQSWQADFVQENSDIINLVQYGKGYSKDHFFTLHILRQYLFSTKKFFF